MAPQHLKDGDSNIQHGPDYQLDSTGRQHRTAKEKRKSVPTARMFRSDADGPHSDVPIALANFDRLPDSAYVRQPVVEGLYGCSSATVWRHVKQGRIPAPKKISLGISAWNVGTLRRVLGNL